MTPNPNPSPELIEAAEKLLLRWKGKSNTPMVKLMANLSSALKARVVK